MAEPFSVARTGDPHDPIAGQEYFRARFLRLNRSTSKEICESESRKIEPIGGRCRDSGSFYGTDTHYTTAVDTKLVKVVFASVSDVILSR